MSKLQKEELVKLQESNAKKVNLIAEIGAVEAHKYAYLQLLDVIIQEQEDMKKELEEKYGAISVDLNDGSFKEISKDDAES